MIVLGFLTLLTILAVSFAISMRTERLSSSLYVNAAQARHLIYVAQSRAMKAIEDDLRWEFETRSGVTRYVDTPMAPTWTVMASTGTANFVDLSVGTARGHIPGVALTTWDGVTNAMNRPTWQNIEVDGQIIGRYAYLAVDCSGLLDLTAIGKRPRIPFESDPAGITPSFEILSEFPNQSSVDAFVASLSNDWKRIESLPELRQALTGAGGAAPDLGFFYSYSPSSEWYDQYHQYVRPRVEVGTNLATVTANKTAFLAAWTDFHNDCQRLSTPYWDVQDKVNSSPMSPTSASHFPMFFDSLLDYLDEDWVPRDLNTSNNEPVPLISEIIFTNRLGSGESGLSQIWTNTLDVLVEIAYVHPNSGNDRTYNLELNLRTRFGDPKVGSSGWETKVMAPSGPRDPKYPASSTWLPNEYRVWVHHFRYSTVETRGAPPRVPVYELTVRVRDTTTGDIVDQSSQITLDAKDGIPPPEWDGVMRVPMNVMGISSKTPLGHQLTELANWDDSRFRIRTEEYRPGYTENWSNVVTVGFFNMQSFLDAAVTSGVNTWLGYSRSQDRLDHMAEIYRIGYGQGGHGLSALSSFSAHSYSTALRTFPGDTGHRRRNLQLWDRFAVSTNLPTRGYINPNSRYSNVLAHAYFNLPYVWFAGIDGYLFRAINPEYHQGLTGTDSATGKPWDYHQFEFRSYQMNAVTSRNLGRKQATDRDVDMTVPIRGPTGLAGPRHRTTYQHMAWHDMVVLNQMKHYEKFGRAPLPDGMHHSGVFPSRHQIEAQACDMGMEWQTGHWTGQVTMRFPPPSAGTLDRNYLLPYNVNAVGAEGWLHHQMTHANFITCQNARQNLFTLVLASQSISPRPVGSTITDADVMAERRAVAVVWRDPWPTSPAGQTDGPNFDKSKRL
ncbi:MAG: hypothetical protein U1E27_00105, partial [Kiritimatiellia bacterium]|nr:hypothetical protein [Kiritimatiellia bacterium]